LDWEEAFFGGEDGVEDLEAAEVKFGVLGNVAYRTG